MERSRVSGQLRRSPRELRGMAGEGARPAADGRRGDLARDPGRGPRRDAGGEHGNGSTLPRSDDARGLGPFTHLALIAAVAISAFLISAHAFGQTVTASRVWPADEYTRVTLEGAKPFKFQSFFVKDPERLVIDLEGLDVNDELRSLATKVREDDPYIKSMRVAVNRPGVARLVFDLKTEVKPQVFPLAPAGEYKHRLVVDIYPAKPKDPLLALLKQHDPIGEMSLPPVTG